MNHPLATERLSLRPFTNGDIDGWHAIWGDADVIWWGPFESFEVSRNALERLIDNEATWADGIGWLAVRRHGEDEIIGDLLVQPAKFIDGIEIGWHFRKQAWGCGYATEAAQAVLDRTLSDGVCETMYAIVAIENVRSLRIVEKIGMSAVRDMEYADIPHRLFSRSRG